MVLGMIRGTRTIEIDPRSENSLQSQTECKEEHQSARTTEPKVDELGWKEVPRRRDDGHIMQQKLVNFIKEDVGNIRKKKKKFVAIVFIPKNVILDQLQYDGKNGPMNRNFGLDPNLEIIIAEKKAKVNLENHLTALQAKLQNDIGGLTIIENTAIKDDLEDPKPSDIFLE
ncbi:hypothetical protein RND71_019210 [Anisodus tanguticus]|uniref:Uncharacterized protein n=1 Tax=Anisodus tanguticus TaxID=243964 RepID=A0AAE1S043_9SOLA|nr:hypothetical protein RND71_019210 [Anisodus tanguticus]